jgi:hypothetical protein
MLASKRILRALAVPVRDALCAAVSLALAASCGNANTPPAGQVTGASGMAPDATAPKPSGSAGGASGSGSATGSSGAAGAPASGGASSDAATNDASTDAGDGGNPFQPNPSPGCFKASTWTGPLGTWVAEPPGCDGSSQADGAPFQTDVCQAIPPGSTPPPNPVSGDPEYRGWWTLVPTGYVVDSSNPYKVIFNANGCPGFAYLAGNGGYPYQNVDNGQAIQVGLDLDTFSERLGCYDGRDPTSNDLLFLPWLMSQIEDELCVDMNHEFFSTYADDASLMQQFNCAFPDKFRGSVSVSGFEPGAPGSPGLLPACVSKPTAAFYVHDFNDTETSYSAILPGCSRVLQQNGCSNTQCDPLDSTLTSPYAVPKGVNLAPTAVCRQFDGCPEDYPVVFCVTYNQGHFDGQSWGVVPLFWDWMANRLR